MTLDRSYRSLLFAPGARPELMQKALHSTADAVILDLEDSVPPDAKPAARENISRLLTHESALPVFVRVHHPDTGQTPADLQALATAKPRTHGLQGVVLPKAEMADEIRQLDDWLSGLERQSAWHPGTLAIVPMVESCLGLRNAFEIATASPRVAGLVLASAEAGDFIVDLGGQWTPESRALMYPRSKLVCDARAAGITWLVDGVFMNLKDNAALRHESQIARELGFVAKMAIHPSQLPVIHEVFSPTHAEIEYSRGLIQAFREAEARGIGAIRYRGLMVDYANVKLAERTLARAQSS